MRFAVALLVALAIFVAVPNAAQAAAAQRHDQVPGFCRLKVGDLEVTALFDGPGVFDSHWLNGTKATMNSVAEALHEDPHMLEVSDVGFLVNTGKQLILVDAGSGTWWGGGAMGRLAGRLRSAGYTPEEVDIVLVTHLHSDHVGGLTTQDGKRVFPNAEVYVAKAESDFWLSPGRATVLPECASHRSVVHQGRQVAHNLAAPRQSSTACNPSRCLVTLLATLAMNSRQRGNKYCFGATPSMHSVSSCSTPRSGWYSTSIRLRRRRRGINCCLS